MAKLSDAQTATLQRGAQQVNGFISPAPKTPGHMAIAQGKKLEGLGLVQEAPCFHDEPFYFRDEDTGDCVGFRLTVDGFNALGIDPSEWPAYLDGALEMLQTADARRQGAADAEFLAVCGLGEPANPMPAAWEAPGPTEHDLDLAEAAADRAAARAEDEAELADEIEDMDEALAVAAVQPEAAEIQRGYDAAQAGAAKVTLRDAAGALLVIWDAQVAAGVGFGADLACAVMQLRLALPVAKAPKAAKPAGEPGVPREGSKLAQVIALLSRPGGALAAEAEALTGWNNTSTRGFISSLKVKRGLAVDSRKEGGTTRYWIGAANAPEPLPAAAPKAPKAEPEAAF